MTHGVNQKPKLWGVGNLKFSRTMHIYKWQPFLDFFIMADTDIPFLLTLGKPETQTLWGLVTWKISVYHIFMKWWPFFNFFIMANADIPCLLTLRKPEIQTLGGSVIWIFLHTTHIYKMATIFQFFHNGQHQYCFLNANFALVQFPHHKSYVQFQHLRVAMLKTFLCGDLSALQ